MKKYNSFDELDRDIAIYNLQRQIDKEEIILATRQVKEAATPSKIVTGALGAIATTSMFIKILSPLLPFVMGKIVAKKK